jgi:hypothetical protein
MSGSNSSAPGSVHNAGIDATRSATAVDAASPLSFTVHPMPTPDLSARRTASGRWKMLAVLGMCALPVAASYFTYFVIRPQGRTNYSEFVTPPLEVPASLPLANLAGQPVLPASLHGQWLLVSVAGGACDSGCEAHLVLQRQLRETLGKDKYRVDKVWLIPDAAVPSAALVQAVTAGDPTTVLRVPAASLAQWLTASPGHTLEQHLYIVDPMGQWMMRTPVDPEPAKLKKDIERLLRASASWDNPGR